MAANLQFVIYSGAGGKYEFSDAVDAVPSATAVFIPTVPLDLWTEGNGRIGLNDTIAQKGKQVWLGGIRGDWGASKIAALVDYWENKSGVGNLVAGYAVRDEWAISEQKAVGDDIALLHSLTSKPIWANILPPATVDAMAQYFNFGADINRYPNIYTCDLYPREASDTFSYSTYTKTIADTAASVARMLDAYKNAPVYLSPANGHVVGLISQAFQQICVNRDDRATLNAGYCVVDQALIDAQMRLMMGQGEYAYLAGATYQRDGRQILQGNATWYVWYDTGQVNGTRINLSGGSNATVRDNLRSWVGAANTNAKANFTITGGVVFQPNAGGVPPSGQVATPSITPATGTFSGAQLATIACSTAGATIYYTLDGSTPTTSSAVYSAAIPISTTTTLKAIAAKSGMTTSAVATSSVIIAAAQPGNITQIKYYPLAGLESRANGGVFAVSNDNQTWTDIYTIPATPPAGWNTVSITTSQLWRYIRFKASASQYAAMSEIEYYNGANKQTGGVISSAFSDGYPAAAAFDGGTGKAWKSAEMGGWVVMDLNAPINTTPALDPLEAIAEPGGEVTVYVRNAERASIDDIAGCPAFAEIGFVRSDRFNVNINEAGQGTLTVALVDGTRLTLSVRGVASTDVAEWRSIVKRPKPLLGYTPTPPVAVSQVETPSIAPSGATYSSAQTVTTACATAGATIRYTTDGTEPTPSSAVYSSPLTVSATTTVKAKAFKSGMTDSVTAMAVYTIASTPSAVTQTIGTGNDTFVIKIAQDYYQGAAQYIIKVDGVQVGGTLTAGAVKSSGASDTINVKGTWGAGAHTVTVEFLNDAYGGTPQTDRNLYVLGITYNGAPMTPANASLLSAGTAAFNYGGAASALQIALWLYYEWESEALTATKDEITPLGFNAVILDATAPNRAAIADIAQSKGLKVWWLLTRDGQDIESLTPGDFAGFGDIVDTVKGKPATAGYYVSDECDKTGSGGASGDALRKSNYAALVSTIKSHDPNHPTVNVSTGLWFSGSVSSTERAYSREFLTMGDNVVMFSLAPQTTPMTTIDAMFSNLKTLFTGDIGAFLPVWIDNETPSYPMASSQQMVDAAMAAKRAGAKYLACWGYKDYRVPIRFSTIGDNATIKARWLTAISSIKAQW